MSDLTFSDIPELIESMERSAEEVQEQVGALDSSDAKSALEALEGPLKFLQDSREQLVEFLGG